MTGKIHLQTEASREVGLKFKIHALSLNNTVKGLLASLVETQVELAEELTEEDYCKLRETNKETEKE